MTKRPVIVKRLPETLSGDRERLELLDLQDSMNIDRPRIVFDCSDVLEMDEPIIHLLLCCLEEAMKRNGDVKLAALPPGSGAVLAKTGIHRVFDIYETAEDAVNSFHRPSMKAKSRISFASGLDPGPEESA